MLRLAIQKLEEYPEIHRQVRLKQFLKALNAWKTGLDRAISSNTKDVIPESYPQIEMVSNPKA